MPRDFPWGYGWDFAWLQMKPSPDARPNGANGTDEWGCVWENFGNTTLGEVKDFPIKQWSDFTEAMIPDVNKPSRWEGLENVREQNKNQYLLCGGMSIYERPHFLRGLENLWVDIYENREKLCKLLDVLVEMNISAIAKYAELGGDGYFMLDDWGLQDSLMINPVAWREIWKPRYAKIFAAAHEKGMDTLLHSCGYIVEILDDFIEIGLDVIQLDQQENMGLELLGERFGGRIAFWSPVDIQKTMVTGDLDDIRAYCRRMKQCLSTENGGFIPKWYFSYESVGHTEEKIRAMCEEFIKIGDFSRRD